MYQAIDQALFDSLIERAQASPRLRSHQNFHGDLSEPVQRLLIGLAQGTFVRPHRHPQAHKWEMILGVYGETALLILDDDGRVLDRRLLGPGQTTLGVELPPNTWHTVLPLTPSAVIMEVKQGPFDPAEAAEFATWAPAEGDEHCAEFLRWAANAAAGDCYGV